jgi:hypothetical protein
MNRFLLNTTELRFEPPARAFARFDQSEPPDLTDAEEALIAFEAVDADWLMRWPGFNGGRDSTEFLEQWAAYWQGLGDPTARRGDDRYAEVPIYRLEMTARRDDWFFQELEKHHQDPRWMEFIADPDGERTVDVFGNLFTAPVEARYHMRHESGMLSRALNIVFDMDTWPDADAAAISGSLSPAADYLAVYDIGQGSANGLLGSDRRPRLYFDLGCGVYRNASTAPTNLKFCWTHQPSIVLSHWDADHWAGANKDNQALSHSWITPRQRIGPVHSTFASSIVNAGGTVLVWTSPSTISLRIGQRSLELSLCTGSGRNGSGIAMTVEDGHTHQSWLLTGDAGYHQLRSGPPSDLSAVVVPHHGANMGPHSQAPSPGTNLSYKRLLYSFGPGNSHGKTAVRHPTTHAVMQHQAQGWQHGTWRNAANPGTSRAGQDVLATAEHLSNHLDGAIVAWAQPPNLSPLPCAGSTPNCTIDLNQS